jgi:hypothetical protein
MLINKKKFSKSKQQVLKLALLSIVTFFSFFYFFNLVLALPNEANNYISFNRVSTTSSSSASSFLSLTDTPDSYAGSGGLCVVIDGGGTGLTFSSCSGTTSIFDYNQTIPANTYTDTQIINNNASWLSTYNNTYNNLLGQNCPTGRIVNGTYLNGTFICKEDNKMPDVNETQFTIEGDRLSIIESWLRGVITGYNYSTNTFNTTYNAKVSYVYANCSGVQVVQNTTANGVQCITPTSVASPINKYFTTEVSTNSTGLTWVTLYTIPLVANTNYSIDCYMLHSSNATTSGIRYNISLADAPDFMVVSEKASTTATASQYSVVSGVTKSMMPIAITASLAYPQFLPDTINIAIDGNANTGGNAIFQFSGELVTLLGVVGKGSYCISQVTT